MPLHPNRFRSTKVAGLLMAVAATLIAAGVIMFVAIGHRAGPRSPALPGGVIDIGAVPKSSEAIPDITSGVPPSGAARLQFTDKADPDRLQSELSFDKLDPAGNGYYTLDQPRAWIYMRDGRSMHIAAASGRVKMPGKAQQPESGEFTGGVTVKMFAPAGTDAAPRAIDPDAEAPVLLATTRSVSFDTVLLELSTDDPLQISTPSLLFNGKGLLVRGNQVRERIELLRTVGESLWFNSKAVTPGSKRQAASVKVVAGATGAGEAPATGPDSIPPTNPASPAEPAHAGLSTPQASPAPIAVKETLYKTVASGEVSLTQAGRSLSADTLELWTRTLDNRLPDDAFAPLQFVSSDKPGQANKPTQLSSAQPQPGAADRATSAAQTPPVAHGLFISAGADDVVLTWSGPLMLAPVGTTTTAGAPDQIPEQLAGGNHFAARFSAERPGGREAVRLSDTATRFAGVCSAVEYHATTRRLRMGSGGSAPRVAFSFPGAGLLFVPALTVNLGSGVSHANGAGALYAVSANAHALTADELLIAAGVARDQRVPLDTGQSRRITWTDQADFQFRVTEQGLAGALDWAAFTGSVAARDRASIVAGDFLRAAFVPGVKQPMLLKTLIVQGNVRAVSRPSDRDPPVVSAQPVTTSASNTDPFIFCEDLEIAFAPTKANPDEAEPVYVLATGAARVGNRDSSLTAPKIEARLGRDESNALTATDVLATSTAAGATDVRFERRDAANASGSITAEAERIRVETRADSTLKGAHAVELTGSPVVLGRGPSTIRGNHIRLDEARSTLIVDGEGTFEHLQTAPGDGAVQVASADGSPFGGAAAPTTRTLAAWKKGMAFDNTRGEILCEGQSTVTSTSALSSQTLKSDRLTLVITPEPVAGGAPPPLSTPSGQPVLADTNRRLLRADALGSIAGRADGENASVEIRRYAATSSAVPAASGSDPARTLETVMYIEGPRIISDEVSGMMTIPAAGRAVVRDQRADIPPASTPKPGANAPPVPTNSRGTSGFTWAGSMDFNRTTGVLVMRKDVELVHVSLDGRQKTRMVAAELAAIFATDANAPRAPGTPALSGGKADLLRADASGAVYAESGPMKLVTDRFHYDARAGTAEAEAQPGNRVTLYDDRKPTPIIARKLFWDLARDRVEVTEPAPVVAPR